MTDKFDKFFKYSGIVWNIAAFVIVVAFFFGGEWERWSGVKRVYYDEDGSPAFQLDDYVTKAELSRAGYIKIGERIKMKSDDGYLASNDGAGRDELDVVIHKTKGTWVIERVR